MSRDWESVLTTWAQGPSATETKRAENAERLIRAAIAASSKLRTREIKVIVQGSYRNRVNVRQESDVDIGVICYDSFFSDYPDDTIKKAIAAEPADYTYKEFKNELEEALVVAFGRSNVGRGAKAFDVKENSYRVDADVAAFFEHRRYDAQLNYISGLELRPDDFNPPTIRNWPEQHYANGVYKNSTTGRKFKRAVRIMKNLRNEMGEAGVPACEHIPSFLIECLVWNVPSSHFECSTYKDLLRSCLAYLFNNTLNAEKSSEWREVSELKYLFRPSQPWRMEKAHEFVGTAWNYVGYE